MIDPTDRNEPEQEQIEINGKLKTLSTTEIDYGTKIAYDITIRTTDPKGLLLAAMKAGTPLKVKVSPRYAPEKANQTKKRR